MVGDDVALVDSAYSTAHELRGVLEKANLLHDGSSADISHTIYVSDLPFRFDEMGEQFLGKRLPKANLVKIEELEAVTP